MAETDRARGMASPRLRRVVGAPASDRPAHDRRRPAAPANGAADAAGSDAPAAARDAHAASPDTAHPLAAGTEASAARPDPCAFCSEPIADRHGHVVDIEARNLLCVCRACALLFDHDAAGGDRYRLVPERLRGIHDFELSDVAWAALRIPVDMAFFFESSSAGRVVAFYPSPMGATESALELRAWHEIEAANPVLEEMEPDVEALLVNRVKGARECFLAPIDECYRLVAVIGTHWRGIGGGSEVWVEIERFFEDLGRRAEPVARSGTSRKRGDHAGS